MVDLNKAEPTTAPKPQNWGQRVIKESETLSTGLPKNGTQRNYPWLYKYKQSRWMWNDERERWYIQLGYLALSPGQGGMSNAPGSWQNAIKETEAKKWHVIRWEESRLDERYQNYCTQYPLAKGGHQYVSIFHSPDVLDDDNEWQRDDDAYFAFLDHLVDVGIVQKRTERMCRQPINKQRARVDRLYQDVMKNPGAVLLEARYRVATKRLARMLDEDPEDALLEADIIIEGARKQAAPAEVAS